MDAATALIAEKGMGASTAAVAKAAGVAEGTLFTYFASKDELLNELYLDLSNQLAQALRSNSPLKFTAEMGVRHILGQLIAWGVDNPLKYRAKYQLKACERVSAETRRRGLESFREFQAMLQASLAKRTNPLLASFYIGSVLPGLADMTIEAIRAHPQDRERLTQATFDLFWKGIKV